jgi:hypothetical protein
MEHVNEGRHKTTVQKLSSIATSVLLGGADELISLLPVLRSSQKRIGVYKRTKIEAVALPLIRQLDCCADRGLMLSPVSSCGATA